MASNPREGIVSDSLVMYLQVLGIVFGSLFGMFGAAFAIVGAILALQGVNL